MDALYVGVVGKKVLFGSIKAKSAHGLLGYSYAVITPNTSLIVNGYYRM